MQLLLKVALLLAALSHLFHTKGNVVEREMSEKVDASDLEDVPASNENTNSQAILCTVFGMTASRIALIQSLIGINRLVDTNDAFHLYQLNDSKQLAVFPSKTAPNEHSDLAIVFVSSFDLHLKEETVLLRLRDGLQVCLIQQITRHRNSASFLSPNCDAGFDWIGHKGQVIGGDIRQGWTLCAQDQAFGEGSLGFFVGER